MGFQNEHDRDKDVDEYIRGKEIIQNRFTEIKKILDQAVGYKTKYPDDVTEINQAISWVKQQCESIIDTY